MLSTFKVETHTSTIVERRSASEEDRNPFSNFILICKSKNINKLEAAKERNK